MFKNVDREHCSSLLSSHRYCKHSHRQGPWMLVLFDMLSNIGCVFCRLTRAFTCARRRARAPTQYVTYPVCMSVCVLSTVQYSRDACSPLLYLCLQFCFLRMYCCWLHGCMFFFLHSYILQIVCCKSPDSGFSEAPWFGTKSL